MITLNISSCVKAPPPKPAPEREVTLPIAYAKDLLLNKNSLAARLNTLKREAAIYKSSLQQKKDLRDEDYLLLNMAYNLALNQIKVITRLVEVLDAVLLKNRIEMTHVQELLAATSFLANEPRVDTLIGSVRELFEEKYQRDEQREFDAAAPVSRDQKDWASIYANIRKQYGNKNFDQVRELFKEHELKDKAGELPTDIAVIYGTTLLNQNSWQEAADWLIGVMPASGDSLDFFAAKIVLAQAYWRLGKEAKAKGIYEELLNRQKQGLKQVKELAQILNLGSENQNGSGISGASDRLIEAETLLLTEQDLEKSAKICADIIRTSEGSPDATKAKSLLKTINQKLEKIIESELQEISKLDRSKRGSKLKNLVERFHSIWPSERIRDKVYERVRAEDLDGVADLSSEEAGEIYKKYSQSLADLRQKNELIAARTELKSLRSTSYGNKAVEMLKEVDDRICKIIRNEAAKIFLDSEKISDLGKRAKVLKSAYKMLVSAQVEYSYSAILDKLKKNAEYVLIEIKKLEPGFEG